MEVTDTAETLGVVIIVILLVAMIVGQLLGQPVVLGYATSDSMSPTINEGDGYVVVPAFLAGSPQAGDIVVFNARTLHGGGLTTHRVVGETEAGYITKGDNNPFTDQDGGEPPVTEGQIVAHVVTVNGHVLTIPHLGTAVEALRGAIAAPFSFLGEENTGPAMVFMGIALFVLAGLVGNDRRRSDERSRDRPNTVAVQWLVLFAVLIVVGAATIAMVLPAGVFEFGLVVTEQPTGEQGVIEPGGTETVTYNTSNGGIMPMLVVTEPTSPGVTVEPERTVLSHGERTPVTVTMTAPDETGNYLRSIRESRYLVVLPVGLLLALHRIHPIVALLAVDVVVAAFVVAASVALFGTGHLRVRSGGRHVPTITRIRRQLRRFR